MNELEAAKAELKKFNIFLAEKYEESQSKGIMIPGNIKMLNARKQSIINKINEISTTMDPSEYA